MHELSICQSLVEIVLAEFNKLDRPGKKLVYADVTVGAMRQIVPEYLADAYELLVKDTAAQGSRLRIREIPVCAKCKDCRWAGDVREMTFLCPQCASPALELTGGMELFLESLEVEI